MIKKGKQKVNGKNSHGIPSKTIENENKEEIGFMLDWNLYNWNHELDECTICLVSESVILFNFLFFTQDKKRFAQVIFTYCYINRLFTPFKKDDISLKYTLQDPQKTNKSKSKQQINSWNYQEVDPRTRPYLEL